MIKKIAIGFTIVIFVLSMGIYSKTGKKFDVLSYKCVGCEDCIKICPVDAMRMKNGKAIVDLDICNGCTICLYICSFNAIRGWSE